MFRVKTTVSILSVQNIPKSIVSVNRNNEIMRSKTLLHLPPHQRIGLEVGLLLVGRLQNQSRRIEGHAFSDQAYDCFGCIGGDAGSD
jgi:hypothetical protein